MIERKLIRPDTLAEALEQREQYQRDALPIAGGQSLLVLLRNKLIDPKVLIDLERVDELRGLERKSDAMSIGAMNTIYNLMSSTEVRAAAPLLSQAASKVGSTAIRNLGTIGGNLCHNEPGADLPPALLALDAAVEQRQRAVHAVGTRKIKRRGPGQLHQHQHGDAGARRSAQLPGADEGGRGGGRQQRHERLQVAVDRERERPAE